MILDDISRPLEDKSWAQVIITLVVDKPEEFGFIEVTPRWRAAGKRIIREHLDGQELELTSVQAGTRKWDRYGLTQQFQLSFKAKQ